MDITCRVGREGRGEGEGERGKGREGRGGREEMRGINSKLGILAIMAVSIYCQNNQPQFWTYTDTMGS